MSLQRVVSFFRYSMQDLWQVRLLCMLHALWICRRNCRNGRVDDKFLLYAFSWVIPRRLNFVCQHFGTHCLFHLHRHTYLPMKMEQTECSETSAYTRIIQMPGNYPEFLLYAFSWLIPRRLNFVCQHFGTLCLFHLHRHTYLPMKMEQSVPKRRHIHV
jgi:hypothetical protein